MGKKRLPSDRGIERSSSAGHVELADIEEPVTDATVSPVAENVDLDETVQSGMPSVLLGSKPIERPSAPVCRNNTLASCDTSVSNVISRPNASIFGLAAGTAIGREHRAEAPWWQCVPNTATATIWSSAEPGRTLADQEERAAHFWRRPPPTAHMWHKQGSTWKGADATSQPRCDSQDEELYLRGRRREELMRDRDVCMAEMHVQREHEQYGGDFDRQRTEQSRLEPGMQHRGRDQDDIQAQRYRGEAPDAGQTAGMQFCQLARPRRYRYDEPERNRNVNSATPWRSADRANRERANVKLTPFTGKEDWLVWINRFEAVAARYHWSNDEKLDRLLPKLQGTAGELIFTQLPKWMLGSYHHQMTELHSRFRVVETSRTYAVKFSRRDQKPGEMAEEYAELKRLYAKAHKSRDDETRQEDLVRRFLDGLRDDEARFEIEFHKAPTSIDEADYHTVSFIQTKRRATREPYGAKNMKKFARKVWEKQSNDSDSMQSESKNEEEIQRIVPEKSSRRTWIPNLKDKLKIEKLPESREGSL